MGKSYKTHRFFCIKCGNEGIPIARKQGHKHERFHRKKLYCPFCKVEINHIECQTDEDVYEMAKIMTTTISLKVPLEAEPELGENWESTKTIPEWLEIKEKAPEKWEALSDKLKKAIIIADSVRRDYDL